jgi:DNA helicase HerA-like ATPase
MTPFAALVPGKGEHAFLVGKTGSGKSFGARRFLQFRRAEDGTLQERKHVVVYDGKGMLRWGASGYIRCTTFKEFYKRCNDPDKFPKVIYAPKASELQDVSLHEAFFRLAYERRHNTVYVDEAYSVIYGPRKDDLPPSYHAILTRGRELGVEIISASQRPKDISLTVMSESTNFYVFKLTMAGDTKRISEMIPLGQDEISALPKHYFYYYRDGEDAPVGPLHLSTGKEGRQTAAA